MKTINYLKNTMKELQHAPMQYDREIAEIIECIVELEALQDENSMYYIETMKLSQPKECSLVCKHIIIGLNSCGSTMDCKKGFKCSRVFKDEFEQKDEQ